jgi:predicted small metal-binding protein
MEGQEAGAGPGKLIQCPCGYEIRAPSDDAVVAAAQEHTKEAHDMELSREQALAMARPE